MSPLFQQLLNELQSLAGGDGLGFCTPPMRRKLYVNTQYEKIMYHWDGANNKPELLDHTAIRCVVEGVSINCEKEFKGKPVPKLHVMINAGTTYTLVLGIETLTAKSLVLNLDSAGDVGGETFLLNFWLSGEKRDQLICDVFKGPIRYSVDRLLKDVSDDEILETVDRVQAKLGQSASAPETHPAAEAKSKPTVKPAGKAAPVVAEEEIAYMAPAEWGPRFKDAREKLGVTDKDVAVEILREAGIMPPTGLKPDRVDERKLGAMIQAIADYMAAPQDAGDWEIEEESA